MGGRDSRSSSWHTARVLSILIPLVIGILGAGGGLYLGRVLTEHGSDSLARAVQVASAVILVAGVGRAAWLAFRDVEVPSPTSAIAASVTDAFDGLSSEQVRAQCNASLGAFEDPEARRAECECVVQATESVRASEPTFSMRVRGGTLAIDGSAPSLAAFRTAYGSCVRPQLAGWVTRECRASCQGDPAGCATGCACVGAEIVRGRTPSALGELFWPPETAAGASRDFGLHNAVVRAGSACQMQ